MSKNTDYSDLSPVRTTAGDRGRLFLVGGTTGLLLGGAALAALYLGASGNVTSSRPLLAQVGAPGAPGAPSPGRPGTPSAPGAPGRPGAGTSFAGAPEGYKALQGGGGAPGGGQIGGPGYTPNIGGGGAPVAGAPAPAGDFNNLKPVRRGAKASGFRKDPFVSFRIQPYQKPPAYSLIAPEDTAPLRLAKYPDPPRPKRNPDPNIEFGPLPYVPRRVAGILIRGGSLGNPRDRRHRRRYAVRAPW